MDEELDNARKELKKFWAMMHRRKVQKSARGEYVGGPITAGCNLPIISQKAYDKYEFGKYKLYPPHAELVVQVLKEFVTQEGSALKTAQVLAEATFPSFPTEDMTPPRPVSPCFSLNKS